MHLLPILVIALLVFAPKRLGEIGEGLGEGIRAVKKGRSDELPQKKQSALETSG